MLIKNDISVLGSGIGYRNEIHDEIFANKDTIDCVEIVTENFINMSEETLEIFEDISQNFSVLLHGLNLSVGSVGVDFNYLHDIKKLCDLSNVPFYTDHLAMTQVPGFYLGHLAPVLYDEAHLKVVCENVKIIQDFLEIPLLLENITEPFVLPGQTFTTEVFFSELIRETGCGILLDVTNIYTNAYNHKFDPKQSLLNMPLDAVAQVHLAGGFLSDDGILIDGHCASVNDEVWDLFELLCKNTTVTNCVLEHDIDFPDFSVLLQQIKKSSMIMDSFLSIK